MFIALTMLLARFLSVSVIRFIAFKAFMFLLFVTVIPYALFKAFSLISSYLLSYISSYLSTFGLHSFVYSVSGLTAWFFQQLFLGQVLSLLFSMLAFKFSIRLLLRFMPR